MDLGVALPTSGENASPEGIIKIAQGAERIGLAAVWTFERLLRPVEPVSYGGGSPPMSLPDAYANVYEPLETLSHVAALTSRVRLGTSIVVSLFHSPVVLGRRLATLDRFCGGRLIAGLGQGWMAQEFAAAGVPATPRGPRFEEHIAAMRALWGPDPVCFEGRYYQIAESQIGPKPTRPEGPPLVAAAAAPAAIERAARIGVGLNPIIFSWDQLRGAVEMFRRAAGEAGHDPGSLPVMVRVNGPITTKPADERAPLTGSVEQVAADLAEARALGVDHVFWSMGTDLDEQLHVLEELLTSI